MRILYLDESGIGDVDKDPILVVAGVLIHADQHWGAIKDRLSTILAEATPVGVQKPRHLHAKDIFHGTKEFHRDLWSQNIRDKLLDDISKIPGEFDIPVVWAAQDRREFAQGHPDDSANEHLRDCYSVSAMACIMQTEILLRSLPVAEMASVVMEQNQELQKRIPSLMDFMNNPGDELENLIPTYHQVAPFKHILDNPSYQPKDGSSILQLADYCAFAIKRFRQGAKNSIRLTRNLAPQLLLYREADLRNKRALWSPKFMPGAWANNVEIRGGKWVAKGPWPTKK